MDKTDVEGVFRDSYGVSIINKTDRYKELRAKAVEEERLKNRINNMEDKMNRIEDILSQILKKVS